MNSATRTAVIGASTAMSIGLALGGVARYANAATGGVARSAPARIATTAMHWITTRHMDVQDVRRTAIVVAGAAIVVALFATWRALAPKLGGITFPSRAPRSMKTPAEPVWALADAGIGRAEIARRTGLSQDAVLLAMYLK